MLSTRLSPYIAIARLSRWSINLFMLTGVFFAVSLTHPANMHWLFSLCIAFLALCCSAFANYTINEWYDAPFDALHPDKKHRPGAQGLLKPLWVWCEYVLLAGLGLSLAFSVNPECGKALICFLIAGLLYNVPPIRLKDIPYCDVLSESVNHPLRFLLGWYAVTASGPLPGLFVFACWALGAYLMTLKRFAEFRRLGADAKRAGEYRPSFAAYSERKLLTFCVIYAVIAIVALSTALILVSPVFYLVVPCLIVLLAWYSWVGYQDNSPVQHPETLYRAHPWLMAAVTAVLVATLGLLYLV